MFMGAHVLLYSDHADEDRAFVRDILGWDSVDVGRGWLIFGMPPAELAVHPSEGDEKQDHAGHKMLGASLYLMCEDLSATLQELESKGVRHTEIETEPWGIRTTMVLPSGSEIGIYQPTHPTMVGR
jgi:hypothetical protein